MSETQQYIGTKLINAWPMTRLAYNELRGWPLPDDENGADDGYLVEYQDGGKANHPAYAGYISWSPKDVFERAYSPLKVGHSFGRALRWLEQGFKVARAGWNGKGMYLYYVPAAKYPASNNANNTMAGVFENDMVPYRAYIAMKTAQNDVVPWVASQSDILESDWVIVP